LHMLKNRTADPRFAGNYPGIRCEWINFYGEDGIFAFPFRALNGGYGKATANRAASSGGRPVTGPPLPRLECGENLLAVEPIAPRRRRAGAERQSLARLFFDDDQFLLHVNARAVGNVLMKMRAGADLRPLSDLDAGHRHDIDAEESVAPDDRAELVTPGIEPISFDRAFDVVFVDPQVGRGTTGGEVDAVRTHRVEHAAGMHVAVVRYIAARDFGRITDLAAVKHHRVANQRIVANHRVRADIGRADDGSAGENPGSLADVGEIGRAAG